MSFFYLFILSFSAATLLPLGSEWYLLHLISLQENDLTMIILLVVVASVANTLGSLLNYIIGRYSASRLLSWLKQKLRIKDNAEQQIKARGYIEKYGAWALLLSWLPIIGDPITFIAGVLEIKWWKFLVLVATAKTLRYVAVAAVYLGWSGF